MMRDPLESWLLCRTGFVTCALPIDRVGETMRILPIEPLSGVPEFLLGVSIIRGAVVPVIELGQILSGKSGNPTRLVTIAVGDRPVALAVDEVVGVREFEPQFAEGLPALLTGAAADVIARLAARDANILVFLESVRIVDAVIEQLDTAS